MTTAQKILDDAIAIGKENPDFDYLAWASEVFNTSRCEYFFVGEQSDDITPGCIFGHAFAANGIGPTDIREAIQAYGNSTGHYHVDKIDAVMEGLHIINKLENVDDDVNTVASIIQEQQDVGVVWGQAVEKRLDND